MVSRNSRAEKIYDMIVLGAGPAGLTAAIYGGRALMSTLVIEPKMVGGEITLTDRLDNYPGFPEGIGGFEFGLLLEKQASRFGAEMVSIDVQAIEPLGEVKKVITSTGVYSGRTLVIATGTTPRTLGVPGEEAFSGRGISFCATCDAPFFRQKRAAVIGGGDAAVEEALYLSRFAEKVLLIHRRDTLRAVSSLRGKLMENPKVSFVGNTVVKEFKGDQKLETIILQKVTDNSIEEVNVDGAFLYIGRLPSSGFVEGVEKDSQGYIITNEEMETSLPGIFAAGDIRRKLLRQVVTAASDGAVAATMALRYIENPASPVTGKSGS
ncbi:MAG TPA: thioredoxin-disulfide reductase [Firmicutes bacterium]|jgi:thioredoxin reductase (NADPH)|nr:thioredoxin-disulfide reductase [Bacillota bacterium]